MRVVWTKKNATSNEIIAALANRLNWKPPTIKTLLGRLVKKEVVTTEQSGHKFIYSPLVTEEQTVRSATENLFSHICSKKIGQTIAQLIDEANLTEEDLQIIYQSIEKKDSVKEVFCNCIPGQCECSEHQHQQ